MLPHYVNRSQLMLPLSQSPAVVARPRPLAADCRRARRVHGAASDLARRAGLSATHAGLPLCLAAVSGTQGDGVDVRCGARCRLVPHLNTTAR